MTSILITYLYLENFLNISSLINVSFKYFVFTSACLLVSRSSLSLRISESSEISLTNCFWTSSLFRINWQVPFLPFLADRPKACSWTLWFWGKNVTITCRPPLTSTLSVVFMSVPLPARFVETIIVSESTVWGMFSSSILYSLNKKNRM